MGNLADELISKSSHKQPKEGSVISSKSRFKNQYVSNLTAGTSSKPNRENTTSKEVKERLKQLAEDDEEVPETE